MIDSNREDTQGLLVGNSAAMRAALTLMNRYAANTATVLVRGETGTGKELAARRIHYQGVRATQPFIAVNCGALPDALVESELFGHSRGAFTDARESHAGLVSVASGGTLFLDEVEALSTRAQIVLLRFLQDLHYRPVGSEGELCANVRVIAASNQNLTALARKGAFREDLMYRLAVMTVEMPPLRARGDDVILLAEHFAARLARQYGMRAKHFDSAGRDVLRVHLWPGNVRELENLIHRRFVLSDDDLVSVSPADLESDAELAVTSKSATASCDFRRAKDEAIALFERRYLTEVLTACGGNVSHAARRAGKERRAFGKLLKKHGIEHIPYRALPLGAQPRSD